jgi:hypothetical protein
MKARKLFLLCAAVALAAVSSACQAEILKFSGYTWDVRPSGSGGPGPNNWEPNNAWVDDKGYLHLRLTERNGKWYCSEVSTQNRLGFGRYQFWLSGRVDQLDKNVVLGLFNYPTPDVGKDGTHEIDIEFAKWGSSSAPIGNYTIWPITKSVRHATKPFSFTLDDDWSTHRLTWSPTSVFFQSLHGHSDDNSDQFASWLYQPENPVSFISHEPMPFHINLWCSSGRAPSDGQEVEVIVRAFKFTPM